jgi:hypothetical protein
LPCLSRRPRTSTLRSSASRVQSRVNTPTHVLIGMAAFGSPKAPRLTAAAALGALLPAILVVFWASRVQGLRAGDDLRDAVLLPVSWQALLAPGIRCRSGRWSWRPASTCAPPCSRRLRARACCTRPATFRSAPTTRTATSGLCRLGGSTVEADHRSYSSASRGSDRDRRRSKLTKIAPAAAIRASVPHVSA